MAQTPAGTPEYTEQHLNAFLDQLLTTADKTVCKHIDLALHHNAQYDQTELLDLLAHCAISGEFDNGGAKTRRHDADGTVVRSDTRCPISRALGRHLRQLDFDSITSQFGAIFEELHSLSRTARLLPQRADVAIDVHDWRYYGDPDTAWVLHTNLARGTNTAFKFLTACIVTDGCRLTVAAEPIRDDDHLPRLTDLVLTEAAEWIDIRRVFLGRDSTRSNSCRSSMLTTSSMWFAPAGSRVWMTATQRSGSSTATGWVGVDHRTTWSRSRGSASPTPNSPRRSSRTS